MIVSVFRVPSLRGTGDSAERSANVGPLRPICSIRSLFLSGHLGAHVCFAGYGPRREFDEFLMASEISLHGTVRPQSLVTNWRSCARASLSGKKRCRRRAALKTHTCTPVPAHGQVPRNSRM